MDDLELIGALLPGSAPPAPEARAQARARLLAALDAELAAGPPRTLDAVGVPRPRARRVPRRAVLLVAVIVALALAVAGLAAAGDVLGVLHVGSSGPSAPALAPGAAPYVTGDELHGLGGARSTLARPIADRRWGTATLSPDGSTLVYESAAASGGSELRRRDLASGADSVLEPATYAPVWSASGELAYGRTLAAAGAREAGAAYPSRIEVRASLDAAPVVWTAAPAAYHPIAWAGSSLLVEQVGNDAVTTVWAYSAPGVARSLGVGWVVAVDPSGSDVLLSDGEQDGPPSPVLRVVDVANGSTVATLDLRTSAGIGAWQRAAPNGTGAWSGGSIVLPASSALVTLTLADGSLGSLGVSSVRRLRGAPELAGADYREAATGASGAASVVLLADVVPPGGGETLPAALACDLAHGTCTVGGIAPRRQPLTLVSRAGALG